MRIVAGALKGRRLVSPKGQGVRPTLEVVREAVFDVLGPRVAGARVLDLFAGSGAMGIEALSRGAVHATWCDPDARAIEAVRENVDRLGVGRQGLVLQMTARAAMHYLERKGRTFDLVFVDPPYEGGHYDDMLLALSRSPVVVDGGMVCVEHPKRIDLPPVFGALIQDRRRRYGETCVSYYARGERAPVREEVPPGDLASERGETP
jgi:16S rRNA (guanine(966)-N(2))-methyltransferase RsmD